MPVSERTRTCVSERAHGANDASGRHPGVPPYTAGLVSQRPALGCLFEIVETLVLTLLIFFVIQNFVAQPYKVQQKSMQRTLEEDQYVLVDKLTPRWDSYDRGDIVVFETPPKAATECGAGGTYVKRLIGLPGETWQERDGWVYIDGRRLAEPYLRPGRRDDETLKPRRIPAGHYFFMGDNRRWSCDSRKWGAVPRADIVGEVFATYWPLRRLSLRY